MSPLTVLTLLSAASLLATTAAGDLQRVLLQAAGGDTCTASSRDGFDCVVEGPGSTLIHYSPPTDSDILMGIEAPAAGWVAIAFPEVPGVMVPAEAVLGWLDDATSQPNINTYELTSRSVPGVVQQDVSFQISDTQAEQDADGTTFMQFRRTIDGSNANCDFTLGGDCSILVGYHANVDGIAFHTFRAGASLTFQNAAAQAAAPALAPAPAPAPEVPTCTASDLDGLDCVVEGPGNTRIHYSPPSDGSVLMAIEAPAAGWVAIAFPETPGVMVPAEAVLGWLDDTTSQPDINTYELTARSVPGVVQQDVSFQISDTQVEQRDDGTTIMQFRRTVDGSDPNCDFTLGGDCSILVGYHSNVDGLAFHTFRAGASLTFLAAADGAGAAAVAPAMEPAMEPAMAPAMEPAMAPAIATPAGMLNCPASNLEGFDCVMDAPGNTRLHYSLPTETDVLLALEAPAAGWAAIAFPETPGVMVPAEAVLGWLDDATAEPNIDTYELTSRSVAGVVQQNVSFQISDAEVSQSADGTTIIQFRRTVDDSNPNCDFRPGGDCEVLVGYHSSADSIAFHTFRAGAQLSFAEAGVGGAVPPAVEAEETPVSETETPMPTQAVAAQGMGPGGCIASSLGNGLECMVQGPANVMVHWGSVTSDSILMAATAPGSGWVSIGFPSSPGVMVGAEAVIGWLESSGNVDIQTYMLNGRAVPQVVAQPVSFEISDTSATEENGMTTVVFRRTASSNANPACDLTSGNCNLIVGYHSTSDGLAFHTERGALSINVLTGDLEEVEIEDLTGQWQAHGWLMIVGWGVLIPFAVIIARTLKDQDPTWYYLHVVLNTSGLILATIAFIWALREFDAEKDWNHRQLGIAVMVLGYVQPFNGFLRPHKHEHPTLLRTVWEWGHWTIGRGALLFAIVNIFLGIERYEQLKQVTDRSWSYGFAAYVFVLFTVYLLLENRKGKLYDLKLFKRIGDLEAQIGLIRNDPSSKAKTSPSSSQGDVNEANTTAYDTGVEKRAAAGQGQQQRI